MSEQNTKAVTSDTVATTQMQEQFAKIGLGNNVTSGEVKEPSEQKVISNTKGELVPSPADNVTPINKKQKHPKQPTPSIKVGNKPQHQHASVKPNKPAINPTIANLLKPHVEIAKINSPLFKYADISEATDTIKFINISIKGKSPLGKFFDFGTPRPKFVFGELGEFKSITGLSYYLMTGCTDNKWRKLSGVECMIYKSTLAASGSYKDNKVPGLKSIMAEALYLSVKSSPETIKLIINNSLPFYSIRKKHAGKNKDNGTVVLDDTYFHVKAAVLISEAIKHTAITGEEVTIDWSKHACFHQ